MAEINFFKIIFSEVLMLSYIAAIKSIIQKQPYTKITNQYLISRMSGNSKQDGIISENIEKYSKRYWLDKIKEELQINWGLKLYAQQTRGFYLSFKMNEKDLIKEVELRKYSYRLNELKRRKEKNRKEIMKYLYEKLNPEKKPPTPPEQPPTPPEQL